MMCDYSAANLTNCRPKLYSLRKNFPIILQELIFPYTINSNSGRSSTCSKKPREETEFGVEGSGVGIETNAKRIGKISFLEKT